MPEQVTYEDFLVGDEEDRDMDAEDIRHEAERERQLEATRARKGAKDERPHS